MGYVEKRKESGVYYGFWYDQAGQRCKQSLRTGNKQVAEKRLKDIELVELRPPEGPALAISITNWIREVDVAAATKQGYKDKAINLARYFGAGRPITDIDESDVAAYKRHRLETVVPHTLKKEMTVLRGVLQREKIACDPIVGKTPAKYEPKTRWLGVSEYWQLLRYMPASRRLWVVVTVHTGARAAELRRLKWEHVDFERNVVYLRETKGKVVVRPIGMSQELRDWLEGVPHEQRVGTVARPGGNYRKNLATACDLGKLARVTPNDLRRTFCSWNLQAGVDPFVVSKLMGHKTMTMIQLVYGHLAQNNIQGAALKVSGLTEWDRYGTGASRTSATDGPGWHSGAVYNPDNLPECNRVQAELKRLKTAQTKDIYANSQVTVTRLKGSSTQ